MSIIASTLALLGVAARPTLMARPPSSQARRVPMVNPLTARIAELERPNRQLVEECEAMRDAAWHLAEKSIRAESESNRLRAQNEQLQMRLAIYEGAMGELLCCIPARADFLRGSDNELARRAN